MLYGCSKLVGGTDGFVPSNTSAGSVCKLGAGGVPTDPNADIREWCKVYFYTDGSVVFTANGAVDQAKTLRALGRLCASAVYEASGLFPGNANKSLMTSVRFASDMSSFAYVNMDYWLYSLSNVTSVTGIGNLANVREMQHAFASCSGLTTLDFRGFDPSHLTNLYMMFGGCSNLATVYADSTWALPSSGLSGSQTFYNCSSLVGGNGTTYSSSRTGYAYMRIDAANSVGYLTAA